MSSHSLGVLLLKMMGLYFVLDVVLGVLGMASILVDPIYTEGIVDSIAITYQVAYVLVTAVFSGVLLLRTERVASWLFRRDAAEGEPPIDARQMLAGGIALLGLYLIATNLATVGSFAGELMWYLEGSRRAFVSDFWQSTWRDTVPRIGAAVVGCVLCWHNDSLGLFLSRSWGSGDKETAPDDTDRAD